MSHSQLVEPNQSLAPPLTYSPLNVSCHLAQRFRVVGAQYRVLK